MPCVTPSTSPIQAPAGPHLAPERPTSAKLRQSGRFSRIVFWGTCDLGKPRVRILIAGAKAAGFEVIECHTQIWRGVEDKSQLKGFWNRLRRLVSWVLAYPSLIGRYLRLPEHEAIIVSYLGQLDVVVLRPFAWLRGTPIVWDAFMSLYDTVVEDRRLFGKRSLRAAVLYVLDWLACRAADTIFLDTHAHAEYFERTFGLRRGTVKRVFVGAETDIFRPAQNPRARVARFDENSPLKVLFYGQFVPLHGIDVIVRAASEIEKAGEPVRWILIGTGQEVAAIERLIRELQVKSIVRIQWVPYEQLVSWLGCADVCLGIFGVSGKASRVIPNKIYQILAARRPLITADTPAIRELLQASPAVRLVPPGDPGSLAREVLEILNFKSQSPTLDRDAQSLPVVGVYEVGQQLLDLLASRFQVEHVPAAPLEEPSGGSGVRLRASSTAPSDPYSHRLVRSCGRLLARSTPVGLRFQPRFTRYMLRGLQSALILFIAAFLIRQLQASFHTVSVATLFAGVHVLRLGQAVIATGGSLGVSVFLWWYLLRINGSPLPFCRCIPIFVYSQATRYVPGQVWAVLGRVALSTHAGIESRVTAQCMLLEAAIGILAAASLALTVLPHLHLPYLQGWQLVFLGAASLLFLHPRTFEKASDLGLRLFRRPPQRVTYAFHQIVAAYAIQLLAWELFGVAFFLLIRAFDSNSPFPLSAAAGTFAAAWLIGYLSILTPSGIGVREAVLILLLSVWLPRGSATLVAFASRVMVTAVELGAFLIVAGLRQCYVSR